MDREYFDARSWELCDQVLGSLRNKQLSPLPHHYQSEFNELLMNYVCDEFTCATINQENSSDNINKYLEIAQLALQAFIQSNQEISKVMQEHTERMNPLHSYENNHLTENCANIVENLVQLDAEMSNSLVRAHEQITQLSTQIEHLTEENTIDPLTKFYNRKELFKDLSLISESLHTNTDAPDCYLLMIDLDDFKEINDNNSHLAGDKTIVYVAKTIMALIRNTDKAYRFGGDEFILVLNRCTLNVAQTIAEKIRASIEKARLVYENREIHVSVSIGVSKLSGKHFETSLLKADKALYEAKRKNKNQVFVITEEE